MNKALNDGLGQVQALHVEAEPERTGLDHPIATGLNGRAQLIRKGGQCEDYEL